MPHTPPANSPRPGSRAQLPVVLVAALLLGCGAPAASRIPAPPDHLPALLQNVPDLYQSTDYTCGCAALAAVLRCYGVAADEALVLREAEIDPEVGIELEEIVRVAAAHGVAATLHEHATLDDLAREIAAGRPAIVLNQSWKEDRRLAWRDDWDDGHYLVVIGIDNVNVYLEDPSLEGARGYIPRAEFVERWHGWTRDERKTEGQAVFFSGAPAAPHAPPPDPLPLEYVN